MSANPPPRSLSSANSLPQTLSSAIPPPPPYPPPPLRPLSSATLPPVPPRRRPLATANPPPQTLSSANPPPPPPRRRSQLYANLLPRPRSSANPPRQPRSHRYPSLSLQLLRSKKIESFTFSSDLRIYGSYVKKEVYCDPNAVCVRHLVEFLRGSWYIVDSRCTNRDLLCFALHMIMMDTGYQPRTVR